MPGASVSLGELYARLDAAYGSEVWHWMPDYVRGPMDVVAGAVLVQHTNWRNAERALDAMRDAGALDPTVIVAMELEALAALIRVSGTPSIKARRLRALTEAIAAAGGLDAFLALPLVEMRPRLLATHGIGPETADAITLYAAGRRVFVIDAYTRRVFRRIGIGPERDGYEDWRLWFEAELEDADVTLFQRYHAWIVLHAKAVCRSRPLCGRCVLIDRCAEGSDGVRAG
jgi:endonuclease-3 related protein